MADSVTKKLFSFFEKGPSKVAGEAVLSSLPPHIRDYIISKQTPVELGGEGSLLVDSPTLAEVSEAKKMTPEKMQEYEEAALMQGVGVPGIGSTRFKRELGKRGVTSEYIKSNVDKFIRQQPWRVPKSRKMPQYYATEENAKEIGRIIKHNQSEYKSIFNTTYKDWVNYFRGKGSSGDAAFDIREGLVSNPNTEPALAEARKKAEELVGADRIKKDLKALNKYEKARSELKKSMSPYGWRMPEDVYAGRKYLDAYAKEYEKRKQDISSIFENAAKAPLSTQNESLFPMKEISKISAPEVSEEAIGTALAKLQRQEKHMTPSLRMLNQEAWRKVDTDEQFIEDFIKDMKYTPVAKKPRTYMEEVLEEYRKIPTPEELAAADRARRAEEIIAAESRPTSTIAGVGTLLPPGRRAGYQKWTGAKKGMNIHFKGKK